MSTRRPGIAPRAKVRDPHSLATSQGDQAMSGAEAREGLQASPGYNEAIVRSQREIDEGKGTPFKEIRSRR